MTAPGLSAIGLALCSREATRQSTRRRRAGLGLVLGLLALATPGQQESPAAAPGATPKTVTVSGRFQGATGEPAADALVELHPLLSPYDAARQELDVSAGATPPNAIASGRTDTDGRFELSVPQPGLYTVAVTPADPTFPEWCRERLLVGDPTGARTGAGTSASASVTEDLGTERLPAGRGVRLRVQGADGPFPAGARLVVGERPSFRDTPCRSAGRQLPETGRTSLVVPEGRRIAVSVVAPGHAVATRMLRESPSTVTLRLEPARMVEVRVVDPGGEPVSEAVAVVDGAPVALSGENGTLRVPLGEDSRVVRVLAEHGHGERSLSAQDAAAKTPPSVVVRPWPTLHGRLIDRETRAPVHDAWIVRSGATARSDEHGGFAIAVEDSVTSSTSFSAGLRARAAGYLEARIPLDGRSDDLGTVSLEPARYLTGTVRNEEGEAIERAELRAGRARALTDAEGRFRLAISRNGTQLEARADGYVPWTRDIPRVGTGADGDDTGVAPLELVLVAGRTAVGWVVDREDRGIAGAQVTLRHDRSGRRDERPRAETDGSGRFALADLGPGSASLSVEATGYASARIPGVEIPAGKGDFELGTVVLDPGVSLHGVVVDSDGLPLAGAGVRAGRAARASATTDAEGRFEVTDLAAGEIQVDVSLEGYRGLRQAGIEVPTAEPVRLVLWPAFALSGRVVDQDEVAVEGATIVAHGTSPEWGAFGERGTSAGDGTFRIDGLPPGRFRLVVLAPDFLESEHGPFDIGPDDPDPEPTLRVQRGYTLSGRVVDPRGEPIEKARVQRDAPTTAGLVPWDYRRLSTAASDADGQFELGGIGPGKLTLRINHRDYQEQARDLEIREDTAVEIRLEPALFLRGRVIDPGGRPAVDARIHAEGGRRYAADAEGAFEITVEPGDTYRLSARQPDVGTSPQVEVTVRDESIEGIELVLEPGGTIRGRVTGLDADRFASVRVSAVLLDADDSLRSSSGVDFEGSFAIENLQPGRWHVSARTREGAGETEVVEIPSSGAEVTVELDFTSGYRVAGLVLEDDAPVPGLEVRLSGPDWKSDWTSPEGLFAFEGVDEGTRELTVRRGRRTVYRESVDVNGDLDLLVELLAGRLDVRVTAAEDGNPLSGVALNLSEGDTPARSWGPSPSTDADGRYSFLGTGVGPHSLTLSGEGRATQIVDVEIEEGGGPVVEVALERAAALILELSGPPGVYRSLTVVRLDERGETAAVGYARVDASRRASLDDVPDGVHRLQLWLSGWFAEATVRVPSEDPLPVTLRETGSIVVEIPERRDSDLRDEVRLVDGASRPHRDRNGRAGGHFATRGFLRIHSVPPGPWLVEAEVEGRTLAVPVEVLPGVTSRAVLE